MPEKLAGLPTPTVAAESLHGERVVAQQNGETHAEAPRRKFEPDGHMTADKLPTDAPWWYHLVANGSFATIICLLLVWLVMSTPSAERIQTNAATLTEKLIDRVLIGQEKLLEKQERVVVRQETRDDALRDTFKAQKRAMDAQFEQLIREAKEHHEAAAAARLEQNKIMKSLTVVLDRLAEKK